MTNVAAMSQQDLAVVSSLIRQEEKLAARIAQIEEDLARAKEEYRRLMESDLPQAMTEIHATRITTSDGSEVEVATDVHASIPKAFIAEAYKWLRRNNAGDIIKNEVTARFGRGEEAEAEAAFIWMENHGMAPFRKESIHPSTLKAFVREKIEAQQEIPMELFGVHISTVAKIRRPK